MSRKLSLAVAVFVVALGLGQKAFGQASGSFAGTVTDKSGSAVVGATVSVASEATGVVRTTTTDDNGHYAVTLLPVSVYSVRVEFKGFQTTESKGVKVEVEHYREIGFKLSAAAVSPTVEVTASEVGVETANPSFGQVITSQQV